MEIVSVFFLVKMWCAFSCLLASVLTIFYIYVKTCQSRWKKLNIPHPKPIFFFGNIWDAVMGRKTVYQVLIDIYNDYPDYKYVGFYKLLDPTVIIRDPDLLAQMLGHDFVHFSANPMEVDEKVDYISAKNPFVLKGHEWKVVRQLLSPMFTGPKLKYIFPISEEIARRMTDYVAQEIDANRGVCVDGKKLCLKYTMDNIATCAFGIDAKSFEGGSMFSSLVQEFEVNTLPKKLKHILFFVVPGLNKYLKLKFIKQEVEQYLTEVIAEAVSYRKQHNIVRNDILDQMNALKEKSTEIPFTDRDVVAQSAGLIIDGVETSGKIAAYALTELGRDQETQRKAREEIRRIRAENGGALTYEGLHEMTYLDAVINETLRLHGPAGGLFKVCTKTYTLPEVSETNNTRLTLHPGDQIFAPFDGFQYDPRYYDEPAQFRPERFLEKNKRDLVKNTFYPFGIAPRNCIGIKFAFMQIKLIFCATIGHYQLDINERMLPFKVHPNSFLKAPLNGFWFDLSKLPEESNDKKRL